MMTVSELHVNATICPTSVLKSVFEKANQYVIADRQVVTEKLFSSYRTVFELAQTQGIQNKIPQ